MRDVHKLQREHGIAGSIWLCKVFFQSKAEAREAAQLGNLAIRESWADLGWVSQLLQHAL